ncbi:response regulator transcription factor [Streptomyces sp. Amel2xC10]|uniref:response regulator transcription factor n=1 Tax=Streptomyces sp. Amel2xC10 TaxID=1305826 RepID=UPI000A15AAD3|nr:response regulator transcription factor [Streptomyces sp. Amel2xC10]
MIRILLAEDQRLLRGALVALLESEPDFAIVAETGSGDEVLPLARSGTPDVALLDIGLPAEDGITAAHRLRIEFPDCRVILLSQMSSPGVVYRALMVGVDGVLPKTIAPDRLTAAIRAVVAGERVVDKALELAAREYGASPLTPRETQILSRIADGATPKAVARELGLSVGSVRNRISSVSAKLGAAGSAEAVAMAERSGWLPLRLPTA